MARDTLALMKRCGVVVTLMLALHSASEAQNQRTAFEYYQEGSRAFVEQRFDGAIEVLRESDNVLRGHSTPP